jgi:hypothetical protein
MSSSSPSLSGITLAITLTAILLVSSPVMTVFSPSPMVLKVEFASATSSENNDDDDNEGGGGEEPTIDATTDGEEEVDGDGDVQEEDNTEEQQLSSSTQEQEELDEDGGEEEEEQLAFMAGEICDDFEDNDGDGFIDLADADCAAPLTQGTVTAPTTPPPTSVTNTTATNSTTNSTTNTATSSALTFPQAPPPTTSDTEPPRAADATPSTTTTSDTGREGREVCDDFEDNDGDGFIDLADADCAAPLTQGTVTTSAPNTEAYSDGSIVTYYPGGISVTNWVNGAVVTDYPDGTSIIKNGIPGDPEPFPYNDLLGPPKHRPGVIHTTYPDKTIIAEYPEGKVGVKIPGFGGAIIYPNGTSWFFGEGSGNIEVRLQPPATEMLVFLILVHLRL